MNKSESKYFNTAVKMDKALIELLEKKIEDKGYEAKTEMTMLTNKVLLVKLFNLVVISPR